MKHRFATLALAVTLAACSDEGATGQDTAAETGWVGEDSVELTGVLRARIEQPMIESLADIEKNSSLQDSLVDDHVRYLKAQLEARGYIPNQMAAQTKVHHLEVHEGTIRLEYEATVDLLARMPLVGETRAPTELEVELPRAVYGVVSREATCLDEEAGTVTESTFYWHFLPGDGCDVAREPVTLRITKEHPRRTVYPEYDRLLGPMSAGRRGARVAIVPDLGDESPREHFDAVRSAFDARLGGTWATFPDSIRTLLFDKATVMVVDLFDPRAKPPEETLKKALAEYDVVFFAGHSRYGSRSILTDSRDFRAGYQVLYLYGCRTYAYYARRALESKALVSGGDGADGIDVVATGFAAGVAGTGGAAVELTLGLWEGMKNVANGQRQKAPTWNAILTRLRWSAGGARVGVVGASTNSFSP